MNNSGLLSLLTSKTAIVVIIVTLSWVGADVSERLFQGSQKNTHNDNPFNVQPMKLPSVTEETLVQIEQGYEKYRTTSTEKKADSAGMSIEEQAKQTGELKSVFIGNKKLELKAVLTEESKINQKNEKKQSVLLQVIDTEKDTSVIEKFSNLDSVYGFQLEVISNTQVQLTKQNNDLQQKIMLTMYKPIPKLASKQ